MTIHTLDKAFSVVLVLFGGLIMINAVGYGLFDDTAPGPGLFPMLAGLVISSLSIVNLVRQLRGHDKVEGTIGRKEIVPVVGISALLTAFVALSPVLGVLLQLPVVLVVMSYFVEPRRGLAWFVQISALSLAVTVFSYFLFEKWLGVLFPIGPLGF